MILAVAFVTSELILKHIDLNPWILPFIFLALSYKLDSFIITALYLAVLSPILCLKTVEIHEYILLLISLVLTLPVYRFALKPRIIEFLQTMSKGTLEQIEGKLKNLTTTWEIVMLIVTSEIICLTLVTGFNEAILFLFYQSAVLYAIQMSLIKDWRVVIPSVMAIAYPILFVTELGVAQHVGLAFSIIMLAIATYVTIKADYYLIKSLMK